MIGASDYHQVGRGTETNNDGKQTVDGGVDDALEAEGERGGVGGAVGRVFGVEHPQFGGLVFDLNHGVLHGRQLVLARRHNLNVSMGTEKGLAAK